MNLRVTKHRDVRDWKEITWEGCGGQDVGGIRRWERKGGNNVI